MTLNKRLIIIVFLFLFFNTAFTSFSQEVKSSTNKRAINYYRKGEKAMGERNFDKVISYAEKAVNADDKFIEAYIMLADAYSFLRNCQLSCTYFEKALSVDPDFSYKLYFFVANEHMRCGNVDKAIDLFEEYFVRAKAEEQEIPPTIRDNYELCLFRRQLIKDSLTIHPQNMGENINSAYSEYLPSLTLDELRIVFTVLRPRDKKTVCDNCIEEEDIYYSEYENGEWLLRTPFDLINTHFNEGGQSISPDGKYLIFTACERDGGYGSCDLYWSKRIGDTWTKPKNFGPPVNTEYWESQPSFSADGKTIIFTSARPGGIGGYDLWYTTMLGEGIFTNPINMGRPINTEADEDYPFFHPNGITLYFSSTGHRGMGGRDIFYSNKNLADETWSEPVNIGYPINTIDDEISLFVNATGNKAFFASNRPGGYGGEDLYWFELPEKIRPRAVTYMKGRIFDVADKFPLEALFKVIDLKTGKMVVSSTSDPKTGEFLICIPTNSMYALHVERLNYLFYSETFELEGEHSDLDPFIKDIYLKRIELGENVVLNNIFFDTDKWELKPESEVELKKLVVLLKDNPNMKIEIAGHTDNIGSREHNLTLSENRAKAVCDYLVSKGISRGRLTYKGYGFDKPIGTNDTEEGRALNRRTEFTITGF